MVQKCCPYGPLIALPAVASFFAFIFTYSSVFGCNLFNAFDIFSPDLSGGDIRRGFGLWTVQTARIIVQYPYYQVEPSCIAYTNDAVNIVHADFADGSFKFAMAVSMIAAILAFPLFILILLPACLVIPPKFFVAVSGVSIVTGVLVILELSGMATHICKSDPNCKIGASGIMAIVAFIMWMVAGGLMCIVPNEPRKERALNGVPEQPAEQKTVTRTKNEDGTVTVTTRITQTNPDGSKVVTETKEVEGDAII